MAELRTDSAASQSRRRKDSSFSTTSTPPSASRFRHGGADKIAAVPRTAQDVPIAIRSKKVLSAAKSMSRNSRRISLREHARRPGATATPAAAPREIRAGIERFRQ